jgi:catechol 2,3-dioxygenase-like lactoylglutathione lyase family enzyme
MHLELAAIIVDDYDAAVDFFTRALRFDLIEDKRSLTNDGRPKRWVEVRPPGSQTGLLLASADGDVQVGAVGHQFAGRVGLFLRVDDFDDMYRHMVQSGVEFITEPSDESYGRFAVFQDIAGNKWDLLGPR